MSNAEDTVPITIRYQRRARKALDPDSDAEMVYGWPTIIRDIGELREERDQLVDYLEGIADEWRELSDELNGEIAYHCQEKAERIDDILNGLDTPTT